MSANYADIGRVNNLEAGFQQVPSTFSEVFTILLWNINSLKSAKKKEKKIFGKNSKKSL